MLGHSVFGETLVNKITTTNKSIESLNNRIYDMSLADLIKKEIFYFRKVKLKGKEVGDKTCDTNFFGMDITRDKLSSLVRKWQTTIEANVDIKTEDGFFLRIFCITFSKKRKKQLRKTSYIATSQIRSIRQKILEIILKMTKKFSLKNLVLKFLSEKLNREIEKACKKISPIQDTFLRKIKILKEKK